MWERLWWNIVNQKLLTTNKTGNGIISVVKKKKREPELKRNKLKDALFGLYSLVGYDRRRDLSGVDRHRLLHG